MTASQKNPHEQSNKAAEAGREGIRQVAGAAQQTAETVQQTVESGLKTASQQFQRATDQFAQVFGFSGKDGEKLAKQSSENFEALAECGTVLARGFQEISREWLGLSRNRLESNLEALNALSSCRSVQDLVAVQSDLVRENMEQMLNNSRRIAELSVAITNEAAQTITAQTKRNVDRARRAA